MSFKSGEKYQGHPLREVKKNSPLDKHSLKFDWTLISSKKREEHEEQLKLPS